MYRIREERGRKKTEKIELGSVDHLRGLTDNQRNKEQTR